MIHAYKNLILLYSKHNSYEINVVTECYLICFLFLHIHEDDILFISYEIGIL